MFFLCWNGGICYNYLGGYLCVCLNGWIGRYCENDINEC